MSDKNLRKVMKEGGIIMGISSDGILVLGIDLDEDVENIPWMDEKYDGDIENWWLDIHEYKSPFEEYSDEYYSHRRDFLKNNPIEVDWVTHCSYDYPMYILAVEGTCRSASRGYSVKITMDELQTDSEKMLNFKAFCDIYLPNIKFSNPEWYLASVLG